MEIYGIKNITNNELNYNYDKHYKRVALKLKQEPSEEQRNLMRKTEQKILSESNNIEIDLYLSSEKWTTL